MLEALPVKVFEISKGAFLLGDNRNDLVIEYIRVVLEMEPKFFIFENVAIFGQKERNGLY